MTKKILKANPEPERVLEKNVVQNDLFTLEEITKQLSEKANLIEQMTQALYQLKGQMALLEEIRKKILVRKAQQGKV